MSLSLAYLAVCGSVVAFVAYFALLKRVGAGPSSYVGVATPVIALLLSTLFEGYRWTPVAAAGMVLAVVGNWTRAAPRGGHADRRGPQSSPSFLMTSTLSIRRVLPSVAAASTISRFG